MDLVLAAILAAAIIFSAWKGGTPLQKFFEAPLTDIANNQSPTLPGGAPLANPWIYPGATQIDNSSGVVTYETTDEPSAVTSWYQDQIARGGMTVTSYIVTNTNDNVINRLVGASADGSEIEVEIVRLAGSSYTTISLGGSGNSTTIPGQNAQSI
ncbi:hypothetical protein M1403_03585 [Patescibacteria group bacterium]|nr:hypothetical protein [Patescibacteria group bacterium]